MNRIFNSDNPVMRALSKLFDIGWLSLIYVVFCIPIITIGPATTALYYTAIKVLRRERGYVWSEFWGCFKSNFRDGLIIGIIMTLLYALLAFNLVTMTSSTASYAGYLYGAYIAMAIVLTCIACYIYPILSRFVLKKTKVLRLAFYMAFRHILFTVILVLIVVLGVVGIYLSILGNLPILILVIPGGLSMLYTLPMEHLMKKYMPKSEPIILENGEEVKPWYEE